jgi:hypothetical protein
MPDWTNPRSWSVGDVLTAADTNTYIRDNTPLFYWKTTEKKVTGTSTETDLLNGEITIAANAMGLNRRLSFWAVGDLVCSGSDAAPPNFTMKLGSTSLASTGDTSGVRHITASAGRIPWVVYAEIQQMNAVAVQEFSLVGFFSFSATSMNWNAGRGFYGIPEAWFYGRNNTAVNMAVAQSLAFTVANGSPNSGYETRLASAKIAIGV